MIPKTYWLKINNPDGVNDLSFHVHEPALKYFVDLSARRWGLLDHLINFNFICPSSVTD